MFKLILWLWEFLEASVMLGGAMNDKLGLFIFVNWLLVSVILYYVKYEAFYFCESIFQFLDAQLMLFAERYAWVKFSYSSQIA